MASPNLTLERRSSVRILPSEPHQQRHRLVHPERSTRSGTRGSGHVTRPERRWERGSLRFTSTTSTLSGYAIQPAYSYGVLADPTRDGEHEHDRVTVGCPTTPHRTIHPQ